MLSQAPADIVSMMASRMETTGINITQRSFLADVNKINESIKSKAGMYLVTLVPSRRNQKQVKTTPQVRKALQESLAIMPRYNLATSRSAAQEQTTVHEMLAGVWINGEEWKSGHFCLYQPASRSVAAHPLQARIAVVQLFLVFNIKQREVVLAQVELRKIVDARGEMFVCETSPGTVEIIHVDCLQTKMMCCPHWDDPDLKCVLRTRSAML